VIREQARDRRIAIAALVLLALLTWMISHTYWGIDHDARLYTLQALAHVYPQDLGNDVFMRGGSQDRYTLFSPLYAAGIRLFGVEPAAAALTLLSQIALCTAAYAVARGLLSARLALLGVSLLIAIPGDYGAARVFSCLEPFLTPRMGAEALVLFGLAAALRGRPAWAVGFVGIAASLHPIMAAAGVVALCWIYVFATRPILAAAAGGLILAVLAVMAFVMPEGVAGRFDADWWQLVEARNPNLFLGFWQIEDWANAAVTLATVVIAARSLPSAAARRLAAAAAVCCGAGLLLTFIACDCWHLVLVTQLQPWRWQWLATVVAALLVVPTVLANWRANGIARVTALLLTAAWALGDAPFVLVPVALLAVLACAAPLRRWLPEETRLLIWGAGAVLGLAILWRVASNLEFTSAFFFDLTMPLWFRRTVSWWHDGTTAAALLVLAWWLGSHAGRHRLALRTLAVLSIAGCAIVLPQAWNRWTSREFSAQRFADFAPMRARIPPGSDVFWPESPLSTWLLLRRPNYLAGFQSAGVVFSRPAALEMRRRAERLADVVAPAVFLMWGSGTKGLILSPPQLRRACDAVDYLVTRSDLGLPPLAVVSPPQGSSGKSPTRLYRCRPS
jgi:hypothetical protein